MFKIKTGETKKRQGNPRQKPAPFAFSPYEGIIMKKLEAVRL
jgi:hypothetical protein